MGRSVPDFNQIPDSEPISVLPENHYQLAIESITETASKEGGHLMYAGILRVTEGEYTNAPLFEYYSVGTTTDPNADDPQTWLKSVGASRLKRLLKAAGAPLSTDMDQMIAAALQQKVIALVRQEVDDGKRDPKYKGKVRNRIGNVYPISEAAGTSLGPRVMPPISGESARPRTQAATPSIPCAYCHKPVPRDQYLAHVETSHPDAE